jgi:hypothetical protein
MVVEPWRRDGFRPGFNPMLIKAAVPEGAKLVSEHEGPGTQADETL